MRRVAPAAAASSIQVSRQPKKSDTLHQSAPASSATRTNSANSASVGCLIWQVTPTPSRRVGRISASNCRAGHLRYVGHDRLQAEPVGDAIDVAVVGADVVGIENL